MQETNPDLLAAVREAERATLSCCMRSPLALAEISAYLRAEHFRELVHQKFWRLLQHLQVSHQPIDLVTIGQEVNLQGWLSDLGPSPYLALASLWEVAGATANVRYYADQVRDYALLRELQTAGYEIALHAEHPTGTAEEHIEEAEKRIFAIASEGVGGDAVPLSVAINEVFARFDERRASGQTMPGLSSGINSLDEITNGWQPSELVLIAARPSVGKTALSLAFARAAAIMQTKTIFFASLEQSRVELGERLLCSATGINSELFKRGDLTEDEILRIADAGDALRLLPIAIDESPSQSVLRIASNARRIALRASNANQPPLGLLVIDYLQLVEPEDRRAPREEQVGLIARRLKMLAKELKIPIIALAQLNRQSENRADGKPKLSDLRDSGQLEQHSDTVLLLHECGNDSPENSRDDLLVIVAKNRNGRRGEIKLRFDRARMSFSELAGGATPFEQGGIPP